MDHKISIIIPTYNRAKLIGETLDSILDQTYENWECIVVDDFSTDNTAQVLHSYLKDSRIIFIEKPSNFPKGANSSRNFGLKNSKGEYVLWFDSDDIMHPNYLKKSIELIILNNLDFCKVNWEIFYNKFDYNFKDEIKHPDTTFPIDIKNIAQILMNIIPINTICVIWKKAALGTNCFNENLLYADEWEYYSRLLSNGLKGLALNNVLIYVRKHPESTTYEYYTDNEIRKESKKNAIRLVTQNLVEKEKLNEVLLKYLSGLAISFRDEVLLNDILFISKTDQKNKLYFKLKFVLFPYWKIYKNIIKKYNQ